jgi:trehalose 6-phosphate synthase
MVSNRGPVVHGRDTEGRVTARRGGGGLVTALDSLAAHHDVTWIASAISEEDREVAGAGPAEDTSRRGSPLRLRLIAHDLGSYALYYNVVANPMLWFIQHRLWDLARAPVVDRAFLEAWRLGYEAVNRGFADAVVEELERQPDAAVLFHDYHLYLAPRFVRDQRPDARLAHFVHIPWVGADDWSILPDDHRNAIYEGLLANDLVGFHSERWRKHFVDGASSFGSTATAVRPVSVDTAELESLARDPHVLERRADLRREKREQLVVRVDRTDPSKNILRGFRAFELLLERYPEHRGRTRMIALLDPSRQDISEYAEYTAEIERTVEEVNHRAGEDVIDLRIGDDFPQSVAGYAEYDVLLVNPIFDGLNLVAKEGPLVNERDGVLVLSANAGAVDELAPWALVVNPFDVGAQADALHEALVMPAPERNRRLGSLRTHVRRHDIAWWADGLLADVERLPDQQG